MTEQFKQAWNRPATWMRWHRWLGYLIGIQLFFWIGGGVFFSIVPFQTWVKGQDLVAKPKLSFPQNWHQQWLHSGQNLAQDKGALIGMQSFISAQGPALRFNFEHGSELRQIDGQAWKIPEAMQIETFAKSIYRGQGKLQKVEKIDQVPTQLGIVKEAGNKKNLWRAQFQDEFNTRLYFDGKTSEFLMVRTDAWVWYDFLWRLHVMDYSNGEDFNNTLLRIATIFAFMMIFTGIVLSVRNLLRQRW
jgi:uncharacterized iron-regulated membrane protein